MGIKIYYAGALVCFLSVALLTNCSPKSENDSLNDTYKNKLIDKDLMLELDSVYTDNNYRFINENRAQDLPDSREFWYTIEELEGYIAFAKKEAEIKNQKVNGVKIKMGQYPAKGSFDSRLNPKLYGYQTVYLVPTVISADGNKTDRKDSLMKGDEPEGIAGMDFSSANPPY